MKRKLLSRPALAPAAPRGTLPGPRAWARTQWGTVQLGDRRLNARAVELGQRMAARPEASLPEQMQSHARRAGAYRLLNNDRVSLAKLLAPACEATRQVMAGAELVLLVHDTTALDYSAHRATGGLGPIGNERGRGRLLHTTLAMRPDTREVLGVAHAQGVRRVLHAKRRKDAQRSAEAKLWETVADDLGPPPAGARWVHVTDRGSDAFEYLSAVRAQGPGCHFVVRLKSNRLLARAEERAGVPEDVRQLDWARQLPARAGSAYEVAVPATGTQPGRTARVVLAWAALTLPPPVNPMPEAHADAPLAVGGGCAP
ncbi:MAG: hypothetical protein M1546_09320, partial [Chloroflexi bacterium]|nr:hypothetical protein [Chloroflexota bacterium]